MTFTIELPYPPPILSPNGRAHWAKVNRARQTQKQEAFYQVRREHGYGRCDSAHVTYTFHAPTRHRFDLDNALASMKGAGDGIASALGCDDSTFTFTIQRGEPRKGGAVIVTVEAK